MTQHQQGDFNPGEPRRGGNGSSQGHHGSEGREFQSGNPQQRPGEGQFSGGEQSSRMGYANYREADELYRGGQDYHGGYRSERGQTGAQDMRGQGRGQGQVQSEHERWSQGGDEGQWGQGQSSYGGGQGSYGQGNYGQGQRQSEWAQEGRGQGAWGQGGGQGPDWKRPGEGEAYGGYGQPYGQGHGQWGQSEFNPGSSQGMGGYSSFQGGEGTPRTAGQHHDPHYLQWRSEQIRKLDEDYEAWNKERYGKFSEEFDTWRRNRQAAASTKESEAGMPSSGSTLQSSRSVAEEGEFGGAGRSGKGAASDQEKNKPGKGG